MECASILDMLGVHADVMTDTRQSSFPWLDVVEASPLATMAQAQEDAHDNEHREKCSSSCDVALSWVMVLTHEDPGQGLRPLLKEAPLGSGISLYSSIMAEVSYS